jgi:type I site-specific restriction endonuclease
MIALQFPSPSFKMKNENGREYIFDDNRKIWLLLTEEEWVRQNFISYLQTNLHYPSPLIAVEKEIQLGELKKRFDILVYDHLHKPWMLVECKAQSVPLTADVLQQVLRYNISVPVPFMVITNGDYTYAWQKTEQSILELESLPSWS